MPEGGLINPEVVTQAAPDGEVDVLDTEAAGGLVVRGGGLRIVTYVAAVLISVAGASLMLRHLGVVDFGRYTTVFSFITIIGALSDLGLTGIGLRQAAVGDAAERERIVRNIIGMRLTTSTIGIAIACAFAIVVGYPAVMVEGIAIAGIGLLALVTQDSYVMQLQISLRLGWTAALEFTRTVGQTLVVVILVVAGASLLAFTGAQIPGAVLAGVIAMALVRHSTRLRPAFEREHWVRLARELLPYAAAAAIGAVYFRVEIVVLSLASTGVQTGLFSTAFRITEVVVGIPWLVASSALPVIARAAEHDRARLKNVLRQMFDASLTAGVGIAVAIFLGAQFAIAVVAGHKYRASVEVLQIQSIIVAFTFLMTQWGFALLALKRTRALLAVNALGLATAIVVTTVLGGAYGANGASVALISAEAALAIGYAFFLTRGGGDLSVRARTAPRVALAAAAAIGAGLISSTPSLVETIIGMTAYVLVLAATGGLPPELFELLPRRRR
ncbi:MAG TPA: oligosaccharide flippase family protein [Solirubrobacteraceae bacterium]|jgi:O-antigen/teichoic acid export membrane protein|nr:oligosaccharide flippase family protein [Solirubrobacteraceae bacterium]